jgi:hypothetical protein
MSLLDDTLRARLPPLHSQEAEDDPMVYARFFLPGTEFAWYPIEGQPMVDDYLFFGFATGPHADFCGFRLSELEAKCNLFDEPVERDRNFTAGRLTDVVPAPDS